MKDIKSNNIPSMSIGKLAAELTNLYSTVINKNLPIKLLPSVMLWGPPGVGKSQAIRQIARETERCTGKKTSVTDVRLLLFNPIDLRGIPTSNSDKTLAIWLKPQIFQMDESDDVINILFLDEISAAPQSVQAAAYQITLDRVVGEHKLPDNCIVIAAGNRVTDKSVAFKMPKALANRLLHIEVEGNFSSWKRWAISKGINSKVIGFLSFRQNYLTPTGDEGYKYTAEEVYEMLNSSMKACGKQSIGNSNGMSTFGRSQNSKDHKEKNGKNGSFELGRAEKKQGHKSGDGGWDDHSRWTITEGDTSLRDVWVKRTIDAAKAIEIQNAFNTRGTMPLFAKRSLKELKKPQTDWRTMLADFIQEEVCDYSFSPPDRRFDDSPFYLPDFNGTEVSVSDILFMVDTSGSMSDDMITAAFSEVKGAIDQFDGKLRGWLGFFDAAIVEPIAFETIEEFRVIQPSGGGGTDFQIIFEFVHQHMKYNPPASIIILTDGYAPFPNQALSDGIPVLWLLNNEEVAPPWGKVARIKVDLE